MADKRKLLRVLAGAATAAVVAGTLFLAVVIMARRAGLSDQLDFGAGAYFYADIPDFKKYVREDVYSNPVPSAVCWLLFFLWGAFVWWLWRRIDKD